MPSHHENTQSKHKIIQSSEIGGSKENGEGKGGEVVLWTKKGKHFPSLCCLQVMQCTQSVFLNEKCINWYTVCKLSSISSALGRSFVLTFTIMYICIKRYIVELQDKFIEGEPIPNFKFHVQWIHVYLHFLFILFCFEVYKMNHKKHWYLSNSNTTLKYYFSSRFQAWDQSGITFLYKSPIFNPSYSIIIPWT